MSDAGKERWGTPSLTRALHELVRDGCAVTLRVVPRHDVASRQWLTLEWEYQSTNGVPPDPPEYVEAQTLAILLRRAAERLAAIEAAQEGQP